ncbi:hypothetical protein MMYC01_201936 [Madurella mycetomatis]|uniref:Uncharacterized protein n=1 Tax=Madurella mycetomatis TaxID=100816 RepID=A0A175WCR5_9PEZI|nr:hypothetical protein MMYC01_201936 [Madurella mycetomatis]
MMVNLDATARPNREPRKTTKPKVGETVPTGLNQVAGGNSTSTAAEQSNNSPDHIASESVNCSNEDQAAPKRLIFINDGRNSLSQTNCRNSSNHNIQANGANAVPDANATADLYPFIVPVGYPAWVFDPAGHPIAFHPIHPWFAGKDEVKFDDPELPHVPVDHRWPYTSAGRANIHLPRFCIERTHRIIEVPGSFVPVIGLLYPNAEFLNARYPPSTNPVHHFNGFTMGKSVLLDPTNEHRKFAVCLRRRDWPAGGVARIAKTAEDKGRISAVVNSFKKLSRGAEAWHWFEDGAGPPPDHLLARWVFSSKTGVADEDAVGKQILVFMCEAWVESDRLARLRRAGRRPNRPTELAEQEEQEEEEEEN